MAKNNALNNSSSTFTVENLLTVLAGGVSITGNTTINVGTVDIGSDTTASTYNFGTGSANKVVVVGSTNSTSPLALKYGTADFTLESATGTVISALDSGEVTMSLQPAFLATLTNTLNDVTGEATQVNVAFDTEIYDQGNNFDGTSFTAPVTARYNFSACVQWSGLVAASESRLRLNSSNRQYFLERGLCGPMAVATTYTTSDGCYADMDAADTILVNCLVAGGTKVVDILGSSNAITYFSGVLVV